MPTAELRVAVDLGVTNVDAVALDAGDQVVARVKIPRRRDAEADVHSALGRITAQPGVDAARISRAMLGSRAALEAAVTRRGLCRAAVVRIGAPLTTAVPPLATWPEDLRAAVSAGEAMVGGGARFDGRPGGPLDTEALAAFLARVAGRVEAVAVTSVFAPVAPEQELAAADVAHRELGADVPVSLSHEIGSLGLLERENATVLNAALVGVAAKLAAGLRRALERRAIDADVFLGQNDGTVMTLEHALRFPVLMIGSGPASAMRGAAWLSGVTGGVVVDVGGAGADVGLLVDGYPREAPPPVRVAGVRANFRMPEVITLPFGGGTVVRPDGAGGAPVVGRANVGRSLTEAALVFGGETATLTDAAVAAGRIELGSRGLTLRERRALAGVLDGVDAQFAHAVDRIKGSRPEVALVVVGGAGGLVPGALPGVSEIIVPADGPLANAIGLAIAPAGGEAHRICQNRPDQRNQAIVAAREEAVTRAIHAGADPDRVAVIEVAEIPLTYMLDPAIRIRVKAAGPRM
jgi:N-methylhydantoinase A/oxoprolinase/acetone carboxylase beta subunit